MSKIWSADDFVQICREHFRENPPPQELLHFGIHGSSTDEKPRHHSDIDFYCICQEFTQSLIDYVPRMMAAINEKTGLWADPMVSCVQNEGLAALNPFTIDTVIQRHLAVYGGSPVNTLQQMIETYRGETSEEYLWSQVVSSGIRIKKGTFIINNYQPTYSSQVFDLNCVRVENPEATKAAFISKHVLTAAAFANCLCGYLLGDTKLKQSFSKREAPALFPVVTGIKSDIPSRALDIYYGGETKGLGDFLGSAPLGWLKVHQQLAEIFCPAIDRITIARLSRSINIPL
jgi:hypothetical protein